MAKKKKKDPLGNVVAKNRRARHDYTIISTVEAGIILKGSEVKSLRAGHCSLAEAFAGETGGEMFLYNVHIPEYTASSHFSHEPRAVRKMLLKKREIATMSMAIKRKGMSVVPLSIYFNDRGIAKVELALAQGKQKADKRAATKDRDWKRDKARLLRNRG